MEKSKPCCGCEPIPEVQIRFLGESNDYSSSEVLSLYREAGWWEESGGDDVDAAQKIVRRSFRFAGAFAGGRLVGMARAISDGVSDAYIQDVTVTAVHRGRGIGKLLVRALVAELRRSGLDWIGLIAQPGTAPFYEDLDFSPMPGHVPMRLKSI